MNFKRVKNKVELNRLVSSYALMVTNKRNSDEAEGIKQKKIEIIPLSFVSVLLFVTIRAYFETSLLN